MKKKVKVILPIILGAIIIAVIINYTLLEPNSINKYLAEENSIAKFIS